MAAQITEGTLCNQQTEELSPCSLCAAAMTCYNTAVISDENQSRTHYLIACTACGYGPAQAFPTKTEAMTHWNEFAKQKMIEIL